MSKNFIRVDEQLIMDEFICLVDRFHDAILREIGIISQGYVDTNGYVFSDC